MRRPTATCRLRRLLLPCPRRLQVLKRHRLLLRCRRLAATPSPPSMSLHHRLLLRRRRQAAPPPLWPPHRLPPRQLTLPSQRNRLAHRRLDLANRAPRRGARRVAREPCRRMLRRSRPRHVRALDKTVAGAMEDPETTFVTRATTSIADILRTAPARRRSWVMLRVRRPFRTSPRLNPRFESQTNQQLLLRQSHRPCIRLYDSHLPQMAPSTTLCIVPPSLRFPTIPSEPMLSSHLPVTFIALRCPPLQSDPPKIRRHD